MPSDPYSVLGLPWGASAGSIKEAFRRLALQHHPDRNPGDASAEERFKLITAAYHKLRDAGWVLPRPRAHPTSPTDETTQSRGPEERPTHWWDGEPIHYPEPEDLESILRGSEGRRRLRAFMAGFEWVMTRSIVVFLVGGFGSAVILGAYLLVKKLVTALF